MPRYLSNEKIHFLYNRTTSLSITISRQLSRSSKCIRIDPNQLHQQSTMSSLHDSHIDEPPSPPQDLSASGLTIPSDSEPYSSLSPPSSSPPQSSNNNEQPVIIYRPPTFWSLLRGAAINLLLPFVNGLMLGFGELFAHEFAFRLGWSQTNVSLSWWS